MRILLTGATGYIGSVVCDALVRAGHEVTALVRNPAKARRLAQSVQLLHADLGEPGTYRDRIAGFDAYVHTAIENGAREASLKNRPGLNELYEGRLFTKLCPSTTIFWPV